MTSKSNFQFPQIDKEKTGINLRMICKQNNITVKDLQDNLLITSNQAIYDWFNGKTLPSIDNLLALSDYLNIDINHLLIRK